MATWGAYTYFENTATLFIDRLMHVKWNDDDILQHTLPRFYIMKQSKHYQKCLQLQCCTNTSTGTITTPRCSTQLSTLYFSTLLWTHLNTYCSTVVKLSALTVFTPTSEVHLAIMLILLKEANSKIQKWGSFNGAMFIQSYSNTHTSGATVCKVSNHKLDNWGSILVVQRILLLATTSRPATGPTQLPT